MTNTNNQNQNPVEHSFNVLQLIQFELKAPKSKDNTFGKYKYRNCEDILEAVKPLLQKHNANLIITDEVQEVGGVVVVTAKVIFTDASGKETIVKAHAGVEISKKGMDVAQTFGASSSYARKYALNGLFLIDDTKDYDSDEYHNQVNNSPARNNNQQNTRQSQQAQNQNNQQQNQHQTANQNNQQQGQGQQQPKKQKRTQSQLFNDALIAIKDATDKGILKAAANRFKGTTYEAGITNACRARADLMGWPTQSKTQQNNQLRH
ncbi:ERF superfamily protein [compost metagenome]